MLTLESRRKKHCAIDAQVRVVEGRFHDHHGKVGKTCASRCIIDPRWSTHFTITRIRREKPRTQAKHRINVMQSSLRIRIRHYVVRSHLEFTTADVRRIVNGDRQVRVTDMSYVSHLEFTAAYVRRIVNGDRQVRVTELISLQEEYSRL